MMKENFRKYRPGVFVLIVCSFLFFSPGALPVSARADKAEAEAQKAVRGAKTSPERLKAFEELKEDYFSDERYSEFIQFLKESFQGDKELAVYLSYYTALARYQQLEYLQKEQKWEEYFDQGNGYKTEILDNVQKAVDGTEPQDSLHIRSLILLWRFHRDQQDAFHQQSMEDMIKAVTEYAKNAQEIAPIKDAADTLQSYGEKVKSETLYRQYAEKLALTAGGAAELKDFARGVYTEGNLDFAQVLYDVYIDNAARTNPLDKTIADLKEIAGLFLSHKETTAYAVKMYDKMEELGGKSIFDEPMTLQRGFAVVRIKDYPKAKDIYQDFIKKFPCSSHYDEALFKLGVIYTYVLRDKDKGRLCFEQVAQKKDSGPLKECGADVQKTTPWLISSLYQLGLLSHWDSDIPKAKEYYNLLLEKAKDGFQDTAALAQERLKEIEEGNQMEYGLRLFLDVSLKPENERYDMSRIDLDSSVVRAKKNVPVEVYSSYYMADTGSMQAEVQYLWSGNIGNAKSSFEDSMLKTAYDTGGTKEINLVVLAPQGVVDRTILLLDVDE